MNLKEQHADVISKIDEAHKAKAKAVEDVLKLEKKVESINEQIEALYELQWEIEHQLEPKTEKFMSLYDYLGSAAGMELGKRVALEAKLQKIKIEEKYVSNPKYEGIVLMYPESFLKAYLG